MNSDSNARGRRGFTAAHGFPLGSLERYKLLSRLGNGGMAEVFLAAWEVAPGAHRPVVVKQLHAHFSEDANLVQMFLDEARLVCRLEHRNIVKTLEIGMMEGRCSIAMEYLEGQPLQEVLRRVYENGEFPVELAISIAIRVLDALRYAHEATDYSGRPLHIVHRDITPHNIFVTNEGLIKVLDFGIAKAATHEGRTATGMVKGKVGYIAPEQARAERVDARADVWSVGVVLWEALTGARLFRADSYAATLNATLTSPIPRASSLRPELSPELDAILGLALERNRARRHASALSMRQSLERVLFSLGQRSEARALAKFMHTHFASEIAAQRRLLSELMAESDNEYSTEPASTSGVVLANARPNADAPASVEEFVERLTRRHLLMLRTLLGALILLVTGVSAFAYATLTQRPPAADATLPSTQKSVVPAALALTAAAAATSRLDVKAPVTAPQPRPAEPSVTFVPGAPEGAVHSTPARATAIGLAPAAATAHRAPAIPPAEALARASKIGFLTLDTTPWSNVSVDGKVLGQTPLVGLPLSIGTHALTLRNPELGIETSYSANIEAGKTTVRRIGIE